VHEILLALIGLNKKEDMNKIASTLDMLKGDANETVNYLRAKSINFLTQRCSQIFLEKKDEIIGGRLENDLISQIEEAREILATIKQMSVKHIYNHESVVKIELAGFRIMSGLIEDFVTAALRPGPDRSKVQQKVLDLISPQYRFEEHFSAYEKVMCIFDFVSGMTDLYALKLYRNLRGIEIPTI
jgi:dGTPase